MGGFILFLIAIIIFVFLFILSAGLSIVRSILKIFTGNRGNESQTRTGNPFFGNKERSDNNAANSSNGEKIFHKDEGEYVDFVEYKEEEPEKP